MSDLGRLRGQVAVLESRRMAQLENAARYRRIAELSRAARDNPPDPSRTYEHQRAMDQRAERAGVDAAHAERQAALTLNEIRGIERELNHRYRQER